MDINTLVGLMRDGGSLLLSLMSLRRSPEVKRPEVESPEEAFERLYRQPESTQKLKQMAAQKAMEAVDEELQKVEQEKKQIARGTACLPCILDHVKTCAGIVSDEAVRMARRHGIGDSEVIKRILDCGSQLNAMEREDLSVEKIAELPKWEKDIAIYAQNKSAEIRHKLNDLRSADDLEKVAVDIKQARDKIGTDYIRRRLRERH